MITLFEEFTQPITFMISEIREAWDEEEYSELEEYEGIGDIISKIVEGNIIEFDCEEVSDGIDRSLSLVYSVSHHFKGKVINVLYDNQKLLYMVKLDNDHKYVLLSKKTYPYNTLPYDKLIKVEGQIPEGINNILKKILIKKRSNQFDL